MANFTRFVVGADDATKLLRRYCTHEGMITGLAAFTRSFGGVRLDKLDAVLRAFPNNTEAYAVEYNGQLESTPVGLAATTILLVQLCRVENAVTRAQPGDYENPARNISATVTRTLHNTTQGREFADDILVTGPTLEGVLDFNTRLSTGELNDLCARPFA